MLRIFSLFLFLFVTFLHAETVLSLLTSIENNHTLHMLHKQKKFVCTPYGVETISQLVSRTDINSSCMNHLYDFRQAHPQENSFAHKILHIQQQYSAEGANEGCLLYLSSNHSYSESLIEHGYGRIPVSFRYEDRILEYRFKRAQQRAKKRKAGIWSDVNIRNCFLVEKKK